MRQTPSSVSGRWRDRQASVSDERDGIKHSWLERALATGRVAAASARLASRRALGRQEGAPDSHIGEQIARELDQMKGLAMKVGQILSYFDGALPAGTHEALRTLQRGAEPVAFATIAQAIEDALGAPVDQLFDSFDPRAVAAASIGQVHRAVHRGEPVAVKVQYPNVRATFESDFARIGALSRIASLATAVDGPALAAELRERVVEECDYEREAAHQEAFARAFAADPAITIPHVVAERSARTVLTTRWHEGRSFYELIDSASAARRDSIGLTLARFAHCSFFALGTLNADPHPGNYLFPDDGPVVFLDFGCVRRFEPEYVEAERNLARVVLEGRRAQFRDAVIRTGIAPRPERIDWDIHWAMLRHQYAPYRTAQFTFDAAYIRRGMDFSGPSTPNLRALAIPPPWIWQQRLLWGLHAVLARLGAMGDFGAILRAALDAPLEPLQPTPRT